MLKVGLVGIGFMGHGHLDQYLRLMKEGAPVKLVALCDVNQKQFEEQFTGGNMGDLGKAAYDFSQFNLYNTFEDMMAKHPTEAVRHAVKGMMPNGKLGRQMYKKLKVYAGPEHNHAAQKPEVLDIK